MGEERRRLAALMLTDLVGYTALSQRDEAVALELLKEGAEIVHAELGRHGGREVKCTGDGYLVEFPSALAAMRSAVAIQQAVDRRNASVPPEEAILLRIGLHLGDVVERAGDLFGDGVNIVSRIEPLAQPGGICVSQAFYDQVWNKTEHRLVCIGTRSPKGIQQPIRVYRVVCSGEPWKPGKPESTDSRRLAVLPLINTSPDPSDAYFADGLTEELIYTLAQLPELKVIAHTSVLRYRGTDKSIAEIGAELGVGSLLEGSVRKAGNRLRIMLQLIDPQSEEHLWAQAYDGALGDVFALQTDIATRVAQALRVTLLEEEQWKVERTPTANMEAYTAYLKGRYLWNHRNEADLRKAIAYFQEAADLDPDYALAYVGLADAYALLPDYGNVPPQEAYPLAREAALKALELDDSLAEAHASLGIIVAHQAFDLATAERELRRAIELNPNYATAHHWYASVLSYTHRFQEAVEAMTRALELDPLSLILNRNLAVALVKARRTDEAIAAFQRVLELDPSFSYANLWLGLAYAQKGDFREALAAVAREEASWGWTPWLEVVRAMVKEMSGHRGALRAAKQALAQRAERMYVPPSCFGVCYLLLGELDQGFAWLERAFAERDEWLLTVMTSSALDPVRTDPRFEALLAKLRSG